MDMPSLDHETLILLFRAQPELAPWLLEHALGVAVAAYGRATFEDATLTQVVPAEYRADAVVVLRNADVPVQAIVVEVQLRRDEDKAYTWPLYVAALRARERCPTSVLVVAPDPGVARWAAQPIDLGGGWLRPAVVGPDAVPRVTRVEQARRSPELAVLSVLAHARAPHAEDIALPAILAADHLDAERATLYLDLILTALPRAARAALEAKMKTGYQYQSDFAKKYFGQGLEQGVEQGTLQAYRQILTMQLEQRFGSVPEPLRRRIDAEMDLERLSAWLAAVPTIALPDELEL